MGQTACRVLTGGQQIQLIRYAICRASKHGQTISIQEQAMTVSTFTSPGPIADD